MPTSLNISPGLAELEARARKEMQLFEYPQRAWTLPTRAANETVHDVCIVGGGQSGIAAALALKQAKIQNLVLLDECPVGGEGPWVTYARMLTLRTIKTLPGPALRVPSLTFEAWWIAQHGSAAWESMVRIPKGDWNDYLLWLRGLLDLDVRSNTRLVRIEQEDGALKIYVEQGNASAWIRARKLVLATGIQGAGGPRIPVQLVQGLPRERWAHTADPIDFRALSGKSIAVLGAGASAFDNAATALEAGAGRVDMLLRRTALPQVNASRWLEFEGLYRHFADLDDAMKWRFMLKIFSTPTPPPQDTLERTMRHPNFHIHFGGEPTYVGMNKGLIFIETTKSRHEADFMILGTGFETRLDRKPEFTGLTEHIAFWRDIYQPPQGEESAAIGAYPYLGDAFQFTERVQGACPILRDIHLFNPGALASIGPPSFGINGMMHGADRLARGISRSLFIRDAKLHHQNFLAYQDPDPLEIPQHPVAQSVPRSAPASPSSAADTHAAISSHAVSSSTL